MKNQVYRNHDSFYANEHNVKPKETFLTIFNLIKETVKNKSGNIKLIDIGCATGDFPAFLVENLDSRFDISGMEYLQSLIDSANSRFPNLNVFQGSIEEKKCIESNSCDYITVLGVISIFDQLDEIVSNLISWVKPGGRIFIHGMFNPEPFDVLVKYRNSSMIFTNEKYENGWNIISQDSFLQLVHKYGGKDVLFHPFNISIDLPKKDDPIRSWTEKLENGERQIVNGICLKQPQFIAEIIC